MGISTTDHKGNKFASIKDMCKYWNIPKGTYGARIRNGWSKQEALETLVGAAYHGGFKIAPYKEPQEKIQPVNDHLGNTFKSEESLCLHWDISIQIYKVRLQRNWSQKEALETPAPFGDTDHMGHVFKTKNDMYEYWKISGSRYVNRIKAGWSQKDALETPVDIPPPRIDHKGNTFPSLAAMCGHYGVNATTYNNKIKRGCTVEKALTQSKVTPYIPQRNKFKPGQHLTEHITMVKHLDYPYTLVLVDGNEVIYTFEQLMKTQHNGG